VVFGEVPEDAIASVVFYLTVALVVRFLCRPSPGLALFEARQPLTYIIGKRPVHVRQ
jgi:hypothetical protein